MPIWLDQRCLPRFPILNTSRTHVLSLCLLDAICMAVLCQLAMRLSVLHLFAVTKACQVMEFLAYRVSPYPMSIHIPANGPLRKQRDIHIKKWFRAFPFSRNTSVILPMPALLTALLTLSRITICAYSTTSLHITAVRPKPPHHLPDIQP